jgi:hypothetical protein
MRMEFLPYIGLTCCPGAVYGGSPVKSSRNREMNGTNDE